MTDQTTDRHTCHNQKAAAGPAWKCPRCSLPPAHQTAPLADRLAHPEAVREQVRRALDFTYAVSLGYESSDELLATYDASRTQAAATVSSTETVPAVSAAPTGLRETAEAVLAVVETALGDTLVPAARVKALAGITAVLPATTNHDTDRRAVLAEAADRAEIVALRLRLKHDYGAANGAYEVMEDLRRLAAECPECGPCPLRRVADETAATETAPDFFQPGRTYTSGTASTLPPAPQWTFQVTTVAESPRGERVALGFLTGATYGCGVWTPHGEHDMAGWTAAGARQDGAQ